MKRLENDQAQLDAELSKLTSSAETCSQEMITLKATLYAKFGKAINLDD
jgi:prefoldin subunit 4